MAVEALTNLTAEMSRCAESLMINCVGLVGESVVTVMRWGVPPPSSAPNWVLMSAANEFRSVSLAFKLVKLKA